MALGLPHPDYLLPFLSAQQFIEWETFAVANGLGVARSDIYWGMFLSMYFNCHLPEHSAPMGPEDFMVYGERQEPPSEDEEYERLKGLLQRIQLNTSNGGNSES